MAAVLERRPYGPPDQAGLRAWRSPSREIIVEGFSGSPPREGLLSPPGSVDDWEEIEPPHSWDHDHCSFCWATFEAAAEVAKRESPDPSIQTEGYVTVGDRPGEWICDTCFADFRDEFKWSVREP